MKKFIIIGASCYGIEIFHFAKESIGYGTDLKMYTGLSAPKLMEALNGNIHYQIFCGIRISPENQLTNYKLIDGILLGLARVRATAMEDSFGTQKEHYG